MRTIMNAAASLLLAIALLSGCASLPGFGKLIVKEKDVRVSVEFGERDRAIIHSHYKSRYKNKNKHKHKNKRVPPGLAKKDSLPPGLEKQLARNGQLPPGLEGRWLPVELEHRLSPLPPGYIRLKVGVDVILMHKDSRVIADIIYNVGG